MTPIEQAEREELQELNERAELAQLNKESLNSRDSNSAPEENWNFSDEVFNSATLGATPYVGALAKTLSQVPFDLYDGKDISLSNMSESYGKNLDATHQLRDDYRAKNPWKSTGASFVGGMGSPIGNLINRWQGGSKLAGSGIGNIKNVRGRPAQFKDALNPVQRPMGKTHSWKPQSMPSQTLGQTIRRGTVAGGSVAGAQGLAESQGDISEAMKSSAFGGSLGGGTPLVIKGGAKLLQGLAWGIAKMPGGVSAGGRFMPGASGMQETLGWRKLEEALARDNHTLESAEKRLNENPNLVVGDLGNNVRSLAYGVYAKPSQGSRILKDTVEVRHKGDFPKDDPAGTISGGQHQRIKDKVNQLYPDTYAGKQNVDEANKAYQSAYKNNPNLQSDKIDTIINSHNGKVAFKKAVDMMSDSGEFVGKNDPEYTALWRMANDNAPTPGGKGISSGLKLKTLDYFKRALQREEKRLINLQDEDGARIINKQVRDVRDELDRLDSTGGEYARGRSLASDDFANKSAYEVGGKFMYNNVNLKHLDNLLEDMNPEQLHNYRIGAMEGMSDQLSSGSLGADKAQGILDNQKLQLKVKKVFGDDKKFAEYLKLVKDEADMSKLRKRMQGSPTTLNQGAVDDSVIDPKPMIGGLVKMGSGNLVGGAFEVLRGLGSKVFMREATADQLGKALTGRNLKGIKTKYNAREISQDIQNALSRNVTQASSPSIGRKKRKPDITLRKSILSAQ